MNAIGYIESPFTGKFGLPRQSGMCENSVETIRFFQPYCSAEAFRGLDGYSHIWIVWAFSENVRDKASLTVRPPRLGGNTRMGVFATRSPFRPNPIGLSCVRLLAIKQDREFGTYLEVSGADLMNGTPILDIKPYIPFADSHPEAVGGFADAHVSDGVAVEISDELLEKLPSELQKGLIEALERDPRPAYHSDPERIYGFEYGGFEVKFFVKNDILTVAEILKIDK